MFIHIAFKDLRILFRDKKALAVMLLMPALIILIIGSAFSTMFEGGNEIEKFSIGVVDRDKGVMSQIFIDRFLKENMADVFTIKVVDDSKADKILNNEEVPSVIYIPEDFTEHIFGNKPVSLQVKSRADEQFKVKIVQSVAGSYAQNLSLAHTGASAIADGLQKYNIPVGVSGGDIPATTMLMFDLQSKLSHEMLSFKEENQEKEKAVSSIQYYSAAMLVMFLLFGANQGTKLIVEERESRTLGRILTAEPGKISLITGKFLGLYIICLLQAVILIVFTRLVYGVVWGELFPGVFLITACSVFAGAGFGMLIAALAKTPKVADGMGTVFIQMSTLIGGGMIPIFYMPDAMKTAAKFTLNWWAFQGYYNLMMGLGVETIFRYCAVLLAMGIVFLGIGIMRFRVN